MSNVPKLRFKEFSGEWEEKHIENILKIGSGKDYKHLSNGNIPVYGTGGYMTSVSDYLYDGESVCIGRKGTIDKPVFLNGKFWTVDTLFYTHSFKNTIPKFVFSIFQKINWKFYIEASGVPSLSKSTIEKIKINIPSKPEQEKIASFLTSVDTKIEQLTKKEVLLQEYKKAVMNKIFNQEIRFKTDDGSEFPEWEIKILKEVCIKIQDGNYGASYPKNEEFLSEGIPFLTSKAIQNGLLLKDKIDYISIEKHKELKKAHLNLHDVLFTNRGSNVGNIGYVDETIGNGNIGPQLTLLRSNNKKLLPIFLFQTMSTYYFQKQIKSQDSGSAMNFFGIGDTSKFKIKIPLLKEQTKIANFLSSIDKKIELTTKELNSTKEFKKALLQQMFV